MEREPVISGEGMNDAPATPRDWKPAVILTVALCFALASALIYVRAGRTYPLFEGDSMLRAGSARELLRTGQWSALTLYHWELVGHEHTARNRPWPVQIWSLGYPLLLAAGFAIFGVNDAVVIGLPILGYLGCVVLVFVLARRLWNLRVATLALVLLLGAYSLVYWSARSHLESVYTCFLLAATLLMLSRRIRVPVALAGGVLLGMAYFIRPTALAFLPLLLLAGVGQRPVVRRRALLAAGTGFILMLAVSVVLTKALSPPPLPTTGPPISYAKMILLRMTPVDLRQAAVPDAPSWAKVLKNWPEVIEKAVRGAWGAIVGVGELFPISLVLLAPLGMVLAMKHVVRRALAGALVAALVLGLVSLIITTGAADRYTADYVPFLALFGAIGLQWTWRRMRDYGSIGGRRVFVLVAVVLIGGPFLGGLLARYSVHPLPEGWHLGRQVASLLPPDAIVGAPKSGSFYPAKSIAWHGGRRGVQMGHFSAEEVLQIDQELIKLDALVLEQSQFPSGRAPAVLGDFRKIATVTVPWRVVKGQTNYHHYAVYQCRAER